MAWGLSVFQNAASHNEARSASGEAAHAGGRRGKERAARHERSSDWRRGAAGSPDPDYAARWEPI